MPAKKTAARKTAEKTQKKAVAPASTAIKAKRGDLIIIDSSQVGSPAREGEVLKVINGEVSVSYQVKWADGHTTLISPVAGTARFVRT